MNLKSLIDTLNLKIIAGKNGLDKNISGCYISDLLSLVMSRALAGNVWITVQTNINIVAVAVLTEVGCIILPEDVQPDKLAINKANIEDIPILSSSMTAYDLACHLKEIL